MDSTDPPPRKRRGGRLAAVLLLPGVGLMATCGYPFVRAELHYHETRKDYSRRSARYDAIVQRLAAQAIAPDTPEYFFIQADRDPPAFASFDLRNSRKPGTAFTVKAA